MFSAFSGRDRCEGHCGMRLQKYRESFRAAPPAPPAPGPRFDCGIFRVTHCIHTGPCTKINNIYFFVKNRKKIEHKYKIMI